jgi:phospholipase/carboxylesterase
MDLDAHSGLSFERTGADRPEALLVLLHGVGGNETNLAGLGAAMDPRAACVRPRGPLTYGPGSHAWFDVRFGPAGPVIDFGQAEAARAQLAALVHSLQEELGLGRDRTVVAGFSQGGIMSASVGLSRPDLVAGFGILSGRILPELEPHIAPPEALRGVRAFVGHGLHDSTLPAGWADRSDAWLRRLEVPCESRRYDAGHELLQAMVEDFKHWLQEVMHLSSPGGKR